MAGELRYRQTEAAIGSVAAETVVVQDLLSCEVQIHDSWAKGPGAEQIAIRFWVQVLGDLITRI